MTMKLKSLRKFGILAVLALTLTSLTSCNRGMGCPSFSVNDFLANGVTSLLQIFGL